MTATANPTLHSVPDVASSRLNSVFLQEEIARERLAFRARMASMIVVSIWLAILMPIHGAVYYYALLLVFVAVGYGHYWITAYVPHRGLPRLALIAIDFGLLSFTLLADNPLNDWSLPPPLRLENGGFAYFFVVLVSSALS